MNRPAAGRGGNRARTPRRSPGFTLTDVLVTMSVIALLIALTLPALGGVKENARRAVCQSNLRQIGLGIAMYSTDFDDSLPPSVFAVGGSLNYSEMMTLRLEDGPDAMNPWSVRGWDGLGILFGGDYLTAPKLFYCPSHHGDHPFRRYADRFDPTLAKNFSQVVANYHYRGIGPNRERHLSVIRPSASSLVADGMRTADDINHKVGTNVLRADVSVSWYGDGGKLAAAVLLASQQGGSGSENGRPWDVLDRPLGDN
ncbi:MAG: type II secretion system protein [Phycisphaerales bacterium JB037]